jgi:hypothetical protein
MQSFGGETCKKEPLRSPRCRWKDNIKRDQELDGGGGKWTGLIELKTWAGSGLL